MRYQPIAHSVLVTGCSSGIGQATACLLRDRGWRVLATARRAEDRARLAAQGIEALPLDLASAQSVRETAAAALDRCGGMLGGLVNNAGAGVPGAVEDLDRDALRAQFEVNLFGLHHLTYEVLPAMLRARAGRIVNVSSVLGRVVIPFMGAYCASKHALEALSDVLRVELADTGIAVCLIEPGPILTDFSRNAAALALRHAPSRPSRLAAVLQRHLDERAAAPRHAGFLRKPPMAVAHRIVHALESPKPRRRYCITPEARLGSALRRLAPEELLDALLIRHLRRRCKR
jgi:NAD(P)-dependent dehydrogenase (short-subunit alcohol dehydrogenase family)